MAAGSLKKIFIYPNAGSTSFTEPLLAFCRVVKLMRENAIQYKIGELEFAVPSNRRYRLIGSSGKFIFDADIPFDPNERILVIYKEPLI